MGKELVRGKMTKIVAMAECHIAGVAALERACFSCPWSEKSLRAELENPLAVWLVAERDGEFAGYIGAQAVMDEADVMDLAVVPQFRRLGVGRALVTALVSALDARGVKRLTLEVRASNAAAAQLYASLGFSRAGVRRNYYEKPREDAVILGREWGV